MRSAYWYGLGAFAISFILFLSLVIPVINKHEMNMVISEAKDDILKPLGASVLTWTTPDTVWDVTGGSKPPWGNPSHSIDDNTGTPAITDDLDKDLQWNLTTAKTCDRVRIYSRQAIISDADLNISLDVYYSSAWHNIKDTTVTKNTWVTITIGSNQTVSKARVSINALDIGYDAYIYEFDFGAWIDESLSESSTYYSYTSTSNNGWNNPERFIDNNRSDYAESQNDGDECALRSSNITFDDVPGKVISKVYMNFTAYWTGAQSWLLVNPMFENGAENGDVHNLTLTSSSAYYEVEVTTDTNAPTYWTWYEAIATYMNLESNLGAGGRVRCSYGGLRVVHELVEGVKASNTTPFNGERDVATSLSQVSIQLNGTLGNFNYSIGGSFLTTASATNCGNGTYTANVDSLAYDTEYTWWVNVSDYDEPSYYWNNYTLSFNTTNCTDYDILIITESGNWTLANEFKSWKEGNSSLTCTIKNRSAITSDSDYWLNGTWGDNTHTNYYYKKQAMDTYSLYNASDCIVRNYVRDQFKNYNISYVILFGAIVPYQEMRTYEAGIGSKLRPTDSLWYGMLNGTQNKYDFSGSWGWRNDDDSTQPKSLSDETLELIPSRFPGLNVTELGYMVNKTKNYYAVSDDDIYCKTYCFYNEDIASPYNDSDDAWTDASYGLNNSYLANIEDSLTFINGTGIAPGQLGQFDNCITQEQVNNSLYDIFNCTNATHPHSAIIYYFHTHCWWGYPTDGIDNINSMWNNTYPYIQAPFGCTEGVWGINDAQCAKSVKILRQRGGSVILMAPSTDWAPSDDYITYFNMLLENASSQTLGEIFYNFYTNESDSQFLQYHGDPTLSFKGHLPISINDESPTNGSSVSSTPGLSVNISYVGGTLDAYWLSNSSGSWVQFATNISIDVSSGGIIIRQTNSNFTSGKYWWSVNVTDGNKWTNETYWFSIKSWQSVETWNITLSNTSSWQSVETWNITLQNASGWRLSQEWNLTLSNTSIWHDPINNWNLTLQNTSGWKIIETWNITLQDFSSWNNIQEWNLTLSNTSSWHLHETWNITLSNSSGWSSIQDWNLTLSNSSAYKIIQDWNITLQNSSGWQLFQTWNITLQNTSNWHDSINNWHITLQNISGYGLLQNWNITLGNNTQFTNIETWNITLQNTSNYVLIANWNITLSNNSIWSTPQTWNITLQNTSVWQTPIANWNLTLQNTTAYTLIQNWNITLQNTTIRAWTEVAQWNITLQNYTNFIVVQNWNITLQNSSKWHDPITNWNLTLQNISSYDLIQDWNITLQNTSGYLLISNWNITLQNVSYYDIQNWNITLQNTSSELYITNENPVNESSMQDDQPILYFTLTNPTGDPMNYSIYIGNSTQNATYLVDNASGVSNGTFCYSNYTNATEYGTNYYWRVYAEDGTNIANETFHFILSFGSAGYIVGGSSAGVIVFGVASLLFFVVAMIFFRRRRKVQ